MRIIIYFNLLKVKKFHSHLEEANQCCGPRNLLESQRNQRNLYKSRNMLAVRVPIDISVAGSVIFVVAEVREESVVVSTWHPIEVS